MKWIKSLLACLMAVLLCAVHTKTDVQALSVNDNLVQDLSSTYAIVIDAETSEVLGAKNADEKMYPASMTKMLTAIVAIESLPDLNQQITITDKMLEGLFNADASVAGFIVGDRPTVEDLLYGIALPSGADATNAVAYTISGSLEAFAEKMNAKAQEIGMTSSHFVNPHGLHDENHYSTARDIAKLLQYCLKNETFRTVFSAKNYVTSSLVSYPAGITMSDHVQTKSEAMGVDLPNYIGGKTGYTGEAGYCLAAWSSANERTYITVTAHSEEYLGYIPDTAALLTRLSTWKQNVLLSTSTAVANVTTGEDTITVYAPDTLVMDLPEGTETVVYIDLPSSITQTYEKQQVHGFLTVMADNTVVYSKDIMVEVPAVKGIFNRLRLKIAEKFD